MDKRPNTRLIDVFIFDDVNVLDIAGPVQAFDNALFNDSKVYRHRYVSLDGKPVRASCGLRLVADERLSVSSDANDLMFPGGTGVTDHFDRPEIKNVIRARSEREDDGRLISICSGAIFLAAAGVLDGKEATTHWSREAFVKQRFEKVLWDLERIYTLSPRVFTSAGVSTGIDLALAIIRMDCGARSALAVAQELVVYLKRSGGQGQFSSSLAGQFEMEDSLALLVEKIVSAPRLDWTLETMAGEVAMSSRTLSRNFFRTMNMSPVQFVEHTRINHARDLMGSGVRLKMVAAASGFGDIQRMRRSFKRHLGVSVLEYVQRFGAPESDL